MLYYNSKDDKFSCVCEDCGKQFYITRTTVYRKMNAHNLCIKCKSCNIIETKKKTDQIAAAIKRKQTCKERYGVENPFQLEKVKQISSENWPQRQEAIKKTMIEKYGVDNCMKVPEIKKKVIITAKKNDPGFKKRVVKIKKTNLERRGHESNFQDKDFNEERVNKEIERYGRPIYSRTYWYDDTFFDSSWELIYYLWLKNTGLDFEYQPKVDFKYIGNDNKEHNYYPDFLVNGEYQEIKGNQFFNEAGEPFDTINKKYWWEKYKCVQEHHVKILRWDDLKPMLEFVNSTYGKDFIKSCKISLKEKKK